MSDIDVSDIPSASEAIAELPADILALDEEEPKPETEASEPEREEPEAEAESPEPEETEEPEAQAAESEETAPDTTDEGEWVEVTLPGGEKSTLPLDEVVKGYSRTDDYQRKTQAVAEQRRTLDTEKQELDRQKQDYAQKVEFLLSQMPQDNPPDPSLAHTDPAEYTALRAEYDARKAQRDIWTSERQRLTAEQQQHQQANQQRFIAEQENQLVQKWPEVGQDISKGRVMIEDIRHGMRDEYGFTESELASLTDHRAILIAKDALAYRKQQVEAPKVRQKLKAKPKVVKPGVKAEGKSAIDRSAKKAARLKKTGHHRDAASLIEDMDFLD